jgi:hypothetical protein
MGGAARLVTMSAAGLILISCALEEEYGLRQPIEMGPWTFEVQRATERIESGSGGNRSKRITLFLKLHNYRERHRKPFDDFLNGTSKPSIAAMPSFSMPRLHLVDGEGNEFDGWVSPMSGGSMRSEHWQAHFVLISMSMRDILRAGEDTDLAAEHVDKHPSDFRLLIENPDVREGQPRRVSIQLE